MNYHIIVQEKFFDEYIEDIYRIHEEHNNVIWVRGNKGDNCYLTTNRPIEYLGNDLNYLQNKLLTLKPEDKLIVSWYTTDIGQLILDMQLPNKLYVYLLGAEFYSMPYDWHLDWLLDPMTKRMFYQTIYMPWYFPLKRPWRWYRIIDWFKFKKRLRKEYEQKLKTIQRIDYIVITEHSDKELDFVRKLYPGTHFKHCIGCFDQNFDIAKGYAVKTLPSEGEPYKIIFGNSSDPNGNHIDAINYMVGNFKNDYEVYSFLSYGEERSKQWTLKYAEKKLGGKFHPVMEYMNRVQFVEFMSKMDLLMMFHNRQQAEGNIMTALVLGKPVFFKPKNPQFEMLKRMGVESVYDVREMHKINWREAILKAQRDREKTIEIIEREYSRDNRLNNLKKMFAE